MMGRLAAVRNRLTYANVVATVALFAALGGASYAAVAVPDNSVGPHQLSFPIGMSSRTGPVATVHVYICPAGESCPGPDVTALASVKVALKKASKLLVIGEAEVVQNRRAKHGSTMLDIGEEFHRSADLGWHYTLRSGSTAVHFSDVLSARPGRQAISVVADLQSDSGPPRSASFINPQIIVIALPALPR